MASDAPLTANQLAESRKALEQFIVGNDDLQALETLIGRFNIFDALGIARAEIRHSNFLAFILDPAESHGQGQLFLSGLLMDVLQEAPHEFPLSAIDVDGTDLRGVEVRREWKNIDLLITCKDPKFAVVVENKIGAHEHSRQLSKYERVAKETFGECPVLHIFLTPDGDDASEEAWITYSYSRLHDVLDRVRRMNENAIGGDVLVFLNHYLNLLGTRIMNDDKLDELCRRIYKTHRQAVELIISRGRPGSATLDEVVNVIAEDSRWHELYVSGKYVDFVPTAWIEWLPAHELEENYEVCVHIRADEKKIWCGVLVGPMEELSKQQRREVVMKLRDDSVRVGLEPTKSTDVGKGGWSRICAVENILKWGEEEQPDPEVIREKLKQKLDELHPKLLALALYLQPTMSCSNREASAKSER